VEIIDTELFTWDDASYMIVLYPRLFTYTIRHSSRLCLLLVREYTWSLTYDMVYMRAFMHVLNHITYREVYIRLD